MRLLDLLAEGGTGAPGFELRGDGDVDVSSVVHDSRVVRPGALFCCIPGAHADGHTFAADAVAAGAVACVVERWVDVRVPQVRVVSARGTLGPLSARFYGMPSRAMQVLGVTGTNGKTTTTYVLEAIARANSRSTGVVGTTGARLGEEALPLPHTTPEAPELQALLAQMRDARVQLVAMEVSSHALDQHRVDGTWFEAVCFTNLSQDHLDYHGTVDHYFAAKARLFTPGFTRRAAINLDDERGAELAEKARGSGLDVLTYGNARGADVRAHDVELGATQTSFVVEHDGETFPVRTTLVGAFNVHNVLAAVTTARLAGLAVPPSIRVCVPGRMERVDAGQPYGVIVDYAHTPDALRAVLDATRPLVGDGGRLLVVFGCGGDRDRAKRPLMGAIAATRADHAYLTNDNPRSEDPQAIAGDVLAGVPEGGAPIVVELDRRAAIRAAVRAARPGDVVVIAGKGHEAGQTANGVTVPFDDRVVAREELEAIA